MSLGREVRKALQAVVAARLKAVRAGVVEGARQAALAYMRSEGRQVRVTRPAVDPKIAGYYANLEVEVGADFETLTKAWKRLLREYHPDRFAGDPARQAAATRLVQDLNHAYRELARYLGAGSKPR